METPFKHVSDTALWIAMYRARESDRADAVFEDPLAARLAGERGKEMVKATPYDKAMAFAMTVRTTAIDKLVKEALTREVDMVINLGAGLDTRPYRLKLPSGLRWIEVDFPATISYKNNLLATEQPNCNLRRVGLDLNSDQERRALFADLGLQTRKALIITEGVIGYLSNEEASKWSQDLFAIPSFQYWIMDYAQGKMRNHKQEKALRKKLKNTPIKFNEENPITFFGQHGWKPSKNIYILDEADRIGRKLPLTFPYTVLMKLFPKKMRELGNKTYGYMLFSRGD